MIAYNALRVLMEEAVAHYEHSAPTVAAYLNDLYIRMNGQADKVILSELNLVMSLREEGQWMMPHYAANKVYKLMGRLGMDTTGHAGF